MKKIFISLYILLYFTTNCFAMSNWQPFSFFNNIGGLNDAFSPIDIADNEASSLQNCVFTTGGSISTRDGYAALNDTAITGTPTCTGIFYYKKSNGDKYIVSIWTNDKIYKMDYAAGAPDGTWDDITGSLSFNVGADNHASFCVAEDTLIIEDGLNSTAPYKWTGTGNCVALGGSPPNGKFVEYHKEHLFIGGNDTYPDRVYFNDPITGTIETWTVSTDFFDCDTNDGTSISGLKKGFDGLYIWKGKSIWRLSGDEKDSFELARFVDGTGTFSHQSIDMVNDTFVFTSSQGDITAYNGALEHQIISTKIQGSLDNMAFNRFDDALGICYDGDYYVTTTTVAGSTHDWVLVFDTTHKAWTKFKGMNVNAWCIADDGAGTEILVFGDYAGKAYKYPSGTSDNGTAIDFFYQTKWNKFDEVLAIGGGFEKYWRLLNVFVKQVANYNLTVEVKSDFETTGTQYLINLLGNSSLYGTARYGVDSYGGQNVIVGRIEPDKGVNFFQVKFSNSILNQPITIRGWYIWVESSGHI